MLSCAFFPGANQLSISFVIILHTWTIIVYANNKSLDEPYFVHLKIISFRKVTKPMHLIRYLIILKWVFLKLQEVQKRNIYSLIQPSQFAGHLTHLS